MANLLRSSLLRSNLRRNHGMTITESVRASAVSSSSSFPSFAMGSRSQHPTSSATVIPMVQVRINISMDGMNRNESRGSSKGKPMVILRIFRILQGYWQREVKDTIRRDRPEIRKRKQTERLYPVDENNSVNNVRWKDTNTEGYGIRSVLYSTLSDCP